MMKKTSKEEQEKRIREFINDKKLYNSWISRIRNEKDPEKRDELCEDPEFLNIRSKFSLGPTYIIWKDDYEDPDYKVAFGVHPSEIERIKKEYEEGIYGSTLMCESWNEPRICIALAYDYGDLYYVVENLNKPGVYSFETMVSPVRIIKYAKD